MENRQTRCTNGSGQIIQEASGVVQGRDYGSWDQSADDLKWRKKDEFKKIFWVNMTKLGDGICGVKERGDKTIPNFSGIW